MPSLEFITIEYPGKGSRVAEPLATNWQELIKDVTAQLTNALAEDEPFLLFGHSMGAKVAYDVCLARQQAGSSLPLLVFFSATAPFNVMVDLHLDDDSEFKRNMIELGGISSEVLADSELSEYVFSTLKADVTLISQYEYHKDAQLKTRAVVFEGRDDSLGTQAQWQEILGHSYEYRQFSGGHFFIFESPLVVINEIKELSERAIRNV